MRIPYVSLCLLAALAGPLGANDKAPKVHVLKPTPKTIVWGYYDSASKPVLKIKSGDTAIVQTLVAGSPATLKNGFLPDEEVEKGLKDVFNEVKDKGPGGHILT